MKGAMSMLPASTSGAILLGASLALTLFGGMCEEHFLSPMPHILSMSVNPDTELRDRSCAPCNSSALGISCCGLCAFWENPRSQHELGDHTFEGQCSARKVERLLRDLQSRGIDLESFEPEQLFETIKGRTLWLIGDSQLSYWFLAVECFLKKFLVSEFRHHPTEALEANLWLTKYVEELPHRGSKRAEPRPAMCTLYQGNTRVCFIRIHRIEEAAHPVLRVLKRAVPNFKRDVVVVNAGLHYGVREPAYRDGLEWFARFVREHRDELATILWKDTSPQHFDFKYGYYWWFDDSEGGTKPGVIKPEKCRAYTEEELASQEIQEGGWFNQVAFGVMRASAINILDTYHETVPLWDFHLKDKDCTHFCNPSGYELWTYLLKEKLFHLQPWLKTLDA